MATKKSSTTIDHSTGQEVVKSEREQELSQLELNIKRSIVDVFRVGMYLSQINEGKLYLEAKDSEGKPFSSIYTYAEDRFGLQKTACHQFINAYRVVKTINLPLDNEHRLLTHTSWTRPLGPLSSTQILMVWEKLKLKDPSEVTLTSVKQLVQETVPGVKKPRKRNKSGAKSDNKVELRLQIPEPFKKKLDAARENVLRRKGNVSDDTIYYALLASHLSASPAMLADKTLKQMELWNIK